MKNFTAGIYRISESPLTSEDKILSITPRSGEKAIFQGDLKFEDQTSSSLGNLLLHDQTIQTGTPFAPSMPASLDKYGCPRQARMEAAADKGCRSWR